MERLSWRIDSSITLYTPLDWKELCSVERQREKWEIALKCRLTGCSQMLTKQTQSELQQSNTQFSSSISSTQHTIVMSVRFESFVIRQEYLFLQQAGEAHRVVRLRDRHILWTIGPQMVARVSALRSSRPLHPWRFLTFIPIFVHTEYNYYSAMSQLLKPPPWRRGRGGGEKERIKIKIGRDCKHCDGR
jgi:hypothetical protein